MFLIRLLVGGVFLSEGIQKFLFADTLSAGRFVKIGIPFPQIMGPFVGGVESLCGVLLLVGLFTRLATIPLLITMGVAILATKLPTLLGILCWDSPSPKLASYGFWSTLHEGRADLSMLFCLLFLFEVGAGTYSLDARFTAAQRQHPGNKKAGS